MNVGGYAVLQRGTHLVNGGECAAIQMGTHLVEAVRGVLKAVALRVPLHGALPIRAEKGVLRVRAVKQRALELDGGEVALLALVVAKEERVVPARTVACVCVCVCARVRMCVYLHVCESACTRVFV